MQHQPLTPGESPPIAPAHIRITHPAEYCGTTTSSLALVLGVVFASSVMATSDQNGRTPTTLGSESTLHVATETAPIPAAVAAPAAVVKHLVANVMRRKVQE